MGPAPYLRDAKIRLVLDELAVWAQPQKPSAARITPRLGPGGWWDGGHALEALAVALAKG